MRRFENIPEYSLRIEFFPNLIKCYDLVSKTVVCSRTYSNKIADIQKEDFNKFRIFDAKGNVIDYVQIDLVSERSKAATGAQYIRDLYMDTPNHGFYIGTYEIGEFSLLQDENLIIKKSYSLKYCSKGCITSDNVFYLGVRESETFDGPHSHYLAKIDWNKNEDPLLLWKKVVPSSIMGIVQIKNYIYLGLKTGDLQIWDITTDKFIKSVHIFHNPLSIIELGLAKIIATSWKGEIASISPEGDIQWMTSYSGEKIETIFEDNFKIIGTDIKGHYFQLNPKNGLIIKRGLWDLISVRNATIASNVIEFRDWFVLTGYGGVWAFWNKEYNKIFHHYLEDPLIRRLCLHPLGLITGDDTGYLRFWKIGGIRSAYQT